MTARDFLKPKNFKIKAKSLSFESVRFMNDIEKKKVYINFVNFLNNHFKQTLFKKNLYQHFHLHCGFIAHYNIHGFYGEYFETAAKYHYNVNGFKNPMHECGGNLNRKSTLSHGEQFYAIYEEINGARDGLGDFFGTLCGNRNYGAYGDYADLDNAIKDAFNEYMEIWREEIKKAVKAFEQFSKKEDIEKLKAKQDEIANEVKTLKDAHSKIEDELIKEVNASMVETKTKKGEQLNLFDFMAA